MARYVMLEFDDNEEAEAFVKAAHSGELYYTKPHPALPKEVSVNKVHDGVRPRGLWFKPVNFCECVPQPEDSARNFVKGSKFGIFVHKRCKRPKKGGAQWPKNLLDPKVVPGAPQKVWLNVKEPVDTAEPTKTPTGELPNMGVSLTEPTPKGETDRVTGNLDSLS